MRIATRANGRLITVAAQSRRASRDASASKRIDRDALLKAFAAVRLRSIDDAPHATPLARAMNSGTLHKPLVGV